MKATPAKPPCRSEIAFQMVRDGLCSQSEAARRVGLTRQGVSVWIARHIKKQEQGRAEMLYGSDQNHKPTKS